MTRPIREANDVPRSRHFDHFAAIAALSTTEGKSHCSDGRNTVEDARNCQCYLHLSEVFAWVEESVSGSAKELFSVISLLGDSLFNKVLVAKAIGVNVRSLSVSLFVVYRSEKVEIGDEQRV